MLIDLMPFFGEPGPLCIVGRGTSKQNNDTWVVAHGTNLRIHSRLVTGAGHGSLETFGGPQRHAIAHLKAGKMVIPKMSSVMLGKSVLF